MIGKPRVLVPILVLLVLLFLAAGCAPRVALQWVTPTPPLAALPATPDVSEAVVATLTAEVQEPMPPAPTATRGPAYPKTATASSQLANQPTKATAPPAARCRSIGDTQVSPVDGMVLLCVPASEFLMGSADTDADANDDEKPQHTVYLNAFWMDRTEVTNAMYAKCVSASGCRDLLGPILARYPSRQSGEVYFGNEKYADYPVINVEWKDADAYCRWAGRQLPTEAQWGKAARGTDGRIYPWGNEPPNAERCNFNENVGDTTPVGAYPAGVSPYGALDMAGNVAEWVADWYDSVYYHYSPAKNPLGPSGSADFSFVKVTRGGDWGDAKRNIRTADRSRFGIDSGSLGSLGFRCARTS